MDRRRFPPCDAPPLDGITCRKRGEHLCEPRARRAERFYTELLVHTKGDFARRPFTLAPWQRNRIVRPAFGTVLWSPHWGRYVRRYQIVYLTVAKKNGKSELVSGAMLKLLAADDEESAEVYGMALDRDQAAIVWNTAARMVALSPVLPRHIETYRSTTRLVHPATASFFTTAAGDAYGALGPNPHGAYIDELLTQADRDLYDAVIGGFGTRAQPMLWLVTTADNNPMGFAAEMRAWAERVAADPELDRRLLPVIYAADPGLPWDSDEAMEAANPGIEAGYLDASILQAERQHAVYNPAAERAYRQFRLNQQTQQAGRAIDLPAWDRSAGETPAADLEHSLLGRECFAGLDLASTSDLASYCLDFPGENTHTALWRTFCPAAALPALDRHTGGQASVWARQGWLTVTDGDVIDYEAIKIALRADAERYGIKEVGFDRWGATQLASELLDEGVPLVQVGQGFATMAAPTRELLRLIAAGWYRHGGNPLIRWQASNMVTRADAAGNLKPDKARSMEKIDSMVAAVMALDRAIRWLHGEPTPDYQAAGF